jgi:hypothetical protein
MKKYLLILTFLFGCFSVLKAQGDLQGDEAKKQEKIQALYVAYVTQQLALTPDEAQKFWPVHAQFTSELKAVKPDLPELDKEQARLNIKKKYQENFTKIVGSNRCERFFRMNEEFRRKLQERINTQRQVQRPRVRRGQ